MKKFFFLLLLCAACIPANSQNLNVGLIDMNDVISSMPELNEVQHKINDRQTQYFNELKLISEEFQRQYNEYNSLDDSVDKLVKERRARLLQETQQKREAFESKAIEELEQLQVSLMTPLYESVQQAIKEIGQRDHYDLIMEKGQDAKIYFYGPRVTDITPEVKLKLGSPTSQSAN